MIELILKNILVGLKTAFFLPSDDNKTSISWHTLFAAPLILIGLHVGYDYIQATNPEFSQWGFTLHTRALSLIILSAYLISLITSEKHKILEFAVRFYYAILPIVILDITMTDHLPSSVWDMVGDAPDYILIIWSSIIAFRIIGTIHINTPKSRKIISSLLIVPSIYALCIGTYAHPFFYSNEREDDEAYIESEFDKLSSEDLFAMQVPLLEKELDKLKPSEKNITDIYAVSFGSYAYQDVFMKEVNYVDERLHKQLAINNRVKLINNEQTVFDTPMANGTNLQKALTKIESISQPDEDILLLYLTSHGGKTSGLSVNIGHGHTMNDLNGERFSNILKNTKIKYKVIFISSCYSGALIPHLKNDDTMIMTASADNKQSYGCSDDADLTYFAEAYFKKALSKTTDLEKAFKMARKYVTAREKREGLEPPSNPQIFIGKNIKEKLQQYKTAPLAKDTPETSEMQSTQ